MSRGSPDQPIRAVTKLPSESGVPVNATEMLESIGESLGSTATVKSVFGEPIHAEGKTVVPVAKVAFGFGAEPGTSPIMMAAPTSLRAEAAVEACELVQPARLRLLRLKKRFIPYTDFRWLVAAFVAGTVLGRLLMRHD